MATIQVRIDDNDKKRAEKILKSLGLDMTTAFRIFVKKINLTEGIPFPIRKNNRTVNGFTPEFEKSVFATEKENDWSPIFDTTEDAITWLNATDHD